MALFEDFLQGLLDVSLTKEVIEFADGGALGIDWLYADDCKEDAPIVLFLPGITGSSTDCSYILYPAQEVYARKWRAIVYNPRGLGGVQLRNKIAYNSARHDDVAEVIERVHTRYPKAKIIGCGFSMGGLNGAVELSRNTYRRISCAFRRHDCFSSFRPAIDNNFLGGVHAYLKIE
ncbi:hypothetical protein GCK32_016646 [Trichostrongylus colubriformis]|uniref:AB hydrolase-1 domain-containing protein n=1 Tax=Trichostrongylus colubriformis TaxID=6319 RepID=A0AAN8F9K1_TRICO